MMIWPNTIDILLAWQDVIAAAETGSGKTLGFGIPIVHRILALLDNGYQCMNDTFFVQVVRILQIQIVHVGAPK